MPVESQRQAFSLRRAVFVYLSLLFLTTLHVRKRSPLMPQPYKTTRLVEFRHTDAAGIVHFSTFFAWMEEVEHEFIRRLGFSVFMKDDEGTISWPRVHTSCDFHAPIRFEDTVDIEISLEKLGASSVHYHFRFTCKGQEVADGKMIAACCRVGQGARPRAIPLPETIANKLRPLL